MKHLVFLLAIGVLGATAAEDLDSSIAQLSGDLVAGISKAGAKKVSVIDFTDLQGRTSDLGRFLAEQISVSLVIAAKDFTVLDRANLKKILDEHKLTAEGLIEPEKARELGKFSGLDTIVIGSATPLGDSLAITAKAISTETTQVIAAARSSVRRTKELEAILNPEPPRFAVNGAATAGGKNTAQDPTAISQSFGDLSVVFESLRALDSQTILVSFIFKNVGDKNAIGVGAYREAFPEEMGMGGFITPYPRPIPLRSTLLGSDGLQFESDGKDLAGIRPIRSNPSDLVEILPGQEIKTSIKFRTQSRFSAVSPAFRLQAEIVMNADFWDSSKGARPGYVTPYEPVYGGAAGSSWRRELPSDCKIHNLVLDIPAHGR